VVEASQLIGCPHSRKLTTSGVTAFAPRNSPLNNSSSVLLAEKVPEMRQITKWSRLPKLALRLQFRKDFISETLKFIVSTNQGCNSLRMKKQRVPSRQNSPD